MSSLSREFNEVVCIDHFDLQSVRLLYCMNMSTRFSSAFIATSASLDEAIIEYESR